MDTLFDTKPTHGQLVDVARNWLRKTNGCSIVVSEITSQSNESPDALGWKWTSSYLVECKASRSDFLADKKKTFRHYLDAGMGDFRWYLAPPGVVRDSDALPTGFGLLEFDKGKVRMIRKAERQIAKATMFETAILLSLIKRIGQTEPEGCSIKCYTYTTKNRTSLDIELED